MLYRLKYLISFWKMVIIDGVRLSTNLAFYKDKAAPERRPVLGKISNSLNLRNFGNRVKFANDGALLLYVRAINF